MAAKLSVSLETNASETIYVPIGLLLQTPTPARICISIDSEKVGRNFLHLSANLIQPAVSRLSRLFFLRLKLINKFN